jgi:hypothetical protein
MNLSWVLPFPHVLSHPSLFFLHPIAITSLDKPHPSVLKRTQQQVVSRGVEAVCTGELFIFAVIGLSGWPFRDFLSIPFLIRAEKYSVQVRERNR